MSKIVLDMDWYDMKISIHAFNNSQFTVNTSQFLSKLETLLQDLSLFENVEVSINTESTDRYETYIDTSEDTIIGADDIGDIWLSSKDCEIMGVSTNNTMQGDLFNVGEVTTHNVYALPDEYDDFLLNDGVVTGNVNISIKH